MKIKHVQLLTLSLLFIAHTAFPATGKAIIPHFASIFSSNNSYHQSEYFFSNITDSPVTVRIKLYGQNGNLITDSGNSSSSGQIRGHNVSFNGAYSENDQGYSIRFDLAANSTGYFYVDLSQYDFGYGSVEWTQAGEASVALIGVGKYKHAAPNGSNKSLEIMLIPINNNEAF